MKNQKSLSEHPEIKQAAKTIGSGSLLIEVIGESLNFTGERKYHQIEFNRIRWHKKQRRSAGGVECVKYLEDGPLLMAHPLKALMGACRRKYQCYIEKEDIFYIRQKSPASEKGKIKENTIGGMLHEDGSNRQIKKWLKTTQKLW
ncbi:unnamed protein product [Lepeophtheirus salmonis]|uniref:(salmon louse) hypothetical protein n=1 Tax=Lepeophtheirus salmonis TaxID=72036 RepID=A0A7R8HAP9_LEPSM|nr:unnamed protein product [Lepeophtheirus salmonis]CAF2970183.1 unnamed protein product [Lepeophtheirus salmonis]